MTCEDFSTSSRTGEVIMKSSCSLQPKSQDTNRCQTIHELNMTLEKELTVFDRSNNVTYRSIACAKCNNAGNLSFWRLKIANCRSPATKRSLKENDQCSWRYVPLSKLKQPYKRCIPQDMVCASNRLPAMSVIRKLCSSYSMPIIIAGLNTRLSFRNPHCALCQPNERKESFDKTATSTLPLPCPARMSSLVPSLSILFDLSSSVLDEKVTQKAQLCPDNQNLKNLKREVSRTLGQITFAGIIVSIISSLFLLVVYLSFKQLRNLPGKCLISLLSAMLCNHIIFLCVDKFQQVELYCKAIAICLHFFLLASFSWMSVMAFETANAFKVYG